MTPRPWHGRSSRDLHAILRSFRELHGARATAQAGADCCGALWLAAGEKFTNQPNLTPPWKYQRTLCTYLFPGAAIGSLCVEPLQQPRGRLQYLQPYSIRKRICRRFWHSLVRDSALQLVNVDAARRRDPDVHRILCLAAKANEIALRAILEPSLIPSPSAGKGEPTSANRPRRSRP